MIWLLLGKLPILLSNIWLTWVTARRTGWFIASIATLVMWSTLALGIYLLPSIIGALLIAIIAHTFILHYFIPKTSNMPRHSAGALALSFGFILIVGRIGCWLSGCCFGIPFDGFWATHYEVGSRAHLHFQDLGLLNTTGELIGLHPVQLYESIGVLCLVTICYLLYRKIRLSEIQASASFAGLYFLLRALIDPLRTEVNTLASLDHYSLLGIELSFFQWGCLAFASFCFFIVYLAYPNSKKHTEPSSTAFYAPTLSTTKTLCQVWVLWLFSWITLWLSATYGTPFSHLLSVLSAWGLGGLCLIVAYRVLQQHLADTTVSFELSFTHAKTLLPIGILLSVIVGLSSQNVSQVISYAYPEQELSFSDRSLADGASYDQAWVYMADPLSKKRARIGRWGEIKSGLGFPPMLTTDQKGLAAQEVDYDEIEIAGKQAKQKSGTEKQSSLFNSKLRLRVSGGNFEVGREAGCGGHSIYHLKPLGGAIDYSFYQTDSIDVALVLSSFKVYSSEEFTDPFEETLNESTEPDRFIHSVRLKLDSKYISGGIGVFIDRLKENDPLPLLHGGIGFNELRHDSGMRTMFEIGIGSGLGDFNSTELIGIYAAVKSQIRLNANNDLLLSLTRPMLLTGDNFFLGAGITYKKVELLTLINLGADQGVMPAMGSLQVGF